MPPPTRIAPAAPGLTSRGSRKPLPSGPVTQTRSPVASSQSASVPGPTPSTQEVEPQSPGGGSGLGDRDRPRQEGRPPPRSQRSARGEHVELAGDRLRALAVDQREDPVAAGEVVAADLAEAAAEGRAHRCLAASAAPAWISWIERTSCSSRLPAAIARAAAVAPVIVVMQGIPWRTAAVRIS